MQGPFVTDAAPEFGHQLKLVPRDIYRVGIAALERWSKANQGKPFAELEPSAQDDILQRLEAGQIDLQDLPAKLLFGQLLQNTHEGFFSDPQHGGNRGLVGWKLVGFPGARADFMDWVDRGEKYPFRRWRFPARGAEHGDDTQTGGRGGGRLRLDRSDPGQGADRGRAQRGGAGARREPRYLSRRRLPEHPRRADLQHPRQAVPESLQEHREHPPRDQRHRAALPPALRLPSRRRRRWRRPALVRRAFPDHARGTAPAQPLRGTLRQEIHPRRHDHPGLRGQLRRAGAALRFRREGLRHLRHRAYGQGPGGRQGQSVRRRPLGRLPAAGTAPGVLRATVPQGRRGTRPAPLRPAGGQRFGALDQPTGCRWGRATSAASAAATPATCIPRPRRT